MSTETSDKHAAPAAAVAALAQTAEKHGGSYEEPPEYRGACARTLFDRPGAEDGTVLALVPEGEIPRVRRNALVRIRSYDRRKRAVEAEYVGVVVSGPFAEPDALSPDAPTLKVAAAHGAVLTPRYHGLVRVQLFGEEVGGGLAPPVRRPAPNSPVFLLDVPGVERVLGLAVPPGEHPVRVGLMDGGDNVPVSVPATRKSVLFKHVGVLGTTGGGKSTTVSGTLAKLADAGNAVVIFDTEGEYTTVCDPTDDAAMRAALGKRGLAPRGVKDTSVYVLAGRQCANPGHPDVRPFKLAFHDLSVHVLVEILGLSEPQERRFLDAYEICKMVMGSVGVFPRNADEQQEAAEVDEFDVGWPRMTLPMMLDAVRAAIEHVQRQGEKTAARRGRGAEEPPEEEAPRTPFQARAPQFKGHEGRILQLVAQRHVEKDLRSWYVGTCQRV